MLPGAQDRLPPLLTLPKVAMVRNKVAVRVNFEFEDPEGRPLGRTEPQFGFPVKFKVLDDRGRFAFAVDGEMEHVLRVAYHVRDPAGNVLASLAQHSSLMSWRYGITLGGVETMTITSNAIGTDFEILPAAGGPALASGKRALGITTTRTDIDIAPVPGLDHRVVLGSILLASYLSIPR